MSEVRRHMFPYGMSKNADGTWTIFNRQYKPLGVISSEWEEWDSPRHKMKLSGLGPATIAKLDVSDETGSDRIYFYDDGCVPTHSAKAKKQYFEKMAILMSLSVKK